jgi:hypothetical protein
MSMSPTQNEAEYDPLSEFFGDDDAKGILDALACLDDCYPKNNGANPVGLLDNGVTYGPAPAPTAIVPAPVQQHQQQQQQQQHVQQQQKPCHPYYYYRDFSTLPDPDPSTPITAPGRIPNFPAKMYAILSRKDLADIITWLPHGRSWKVLKPREFEVKVIPTYFEHSKFSSFIRQANGWGFRRIISKGPDRNSYYHELFLRSRPHLIKLMRRPPPSSKPLADATTEPDFLAISEERPLPEIKDGDAATDAVARGNFPRQATYSFIPPPSYKPPVPAPRAAPAPAPIAPAPVQLVPSPQLQQQVYGQATPVHSHQQLPPAPTMSHAPAAPTSGYDPYSGQPQYQQQHQPQQQQQQQYQYALAPAAAAPAPDDIKPNDILSCGPAIHPVESTDSLLDLLNKPLPPPELFGSHTFYPLLD